ncbi:hypothetical protein QFC21_003374 [Naganishia friedmannii]|uniref:Uncharacterized protein n=1 Tax=Naganishia friedmannii TaxID=89922 RepID=A0ACC2VR95_9TREE|nr:hypothetical protein QFC21_003374 [Naganishia friedmannii]
MPKLETQIPKLLAGDFSVDQKKRPTRAEKRAAAAETRPQEPEQKKNNKKKKKARRSEEKAETSSQSRSQTTNLQQSSSMSASNSSSKPYDARGGQDGRGDGRGQQNPSQVIGTGHFVADSMPGRKRKFDLMQQEQTRSIGNRNLAPWCSDIDWFSASNMTQLLNDEILACSAWMSPTFEEHETRCMMIKKIIRLIQQTEPNARIYAFGSHETKLYLPGGDIDIVIDIDSVRIKNPRTLFNTLVSRLAYNGICRQYDVEKILHARVPIIKLKTLQGNIKIDISLYNTNGVKAGEVVKQYLDALPAARPLVLLIKAFMWRLNKNEVFAGGLGSYSTICLAISFLQQHPKIRNNEIDPMKNLGILLIEFFELYGLNFNWQDLGISIREGGTYYRKRDRGWFKQGIQPNISIEDPQDKTYEILMANMKGRTEELRSWQMTTRTSSFNTYHSNWVDGVGRFDAQRMSLLTGIIGFDVATMNHRSGLDKLYHLRELQVELNIPYISPPSTAKRALELQSETKTTPSTDNFSVSVPSSTSLPTLPKSRAQAQSSRQDTVSAIMMAESDPEDVGQGDGGADYFDSDSDVSDNRASRSGPAKRRRIRTPSDEDSVSSARPRSVIEVSDSDSEDESSRYKPRPKRGAVKGSKEAEMDIGTDDAYDDDGVIDLDEDSDEVEILNNRGPSTSTEVPVVHFSETTSRPRNPPTKGHTFTSANSDFKGRGPKARPRIKTPETQDETSPPGKKSRPSKASRKEFWQSKSGVEPGSRPRGQEADDYGQFEEDWQADLNGARARAESTTDDAVAANEDFIAF